MIRFPIILTGSKPYSRGRLRILLPKKQSQKDGRTPEKWKRTLFSGVFFLTLSNLLTKFCGLFLKVPLTNTLGDTGMAYFNLAYAVYKWFYMISTAGLPVAVAVMTAEGVRERNGTKVRTVRNLSLILFFVVGTAGSLAMAIGAPAFASLQKVPAAKTAIAAIAPALLFICVSSALRGWYQGLSDLRPAAVSQVAEAAAKMICGLIFAGYALGRGYPMPTVAAFAISGLSVGCLLGMFVMLAVLPQKNREAAALPDECPERESRRALCRRLIGIAVPVTLSASVLSLSDMLDSMIVIRRLLGTGTAADEALRLYGSYTALAVPMFNLPPVLIYPVTTALVPVIAGADAEKRKKLIRSAVRLTGILALPCAAGLSVMAEPVLSLFFRRDLAKTGAPLLALLAPAVFFLSVLAVTNAVLQASDGAVLPVISMTAGAAVKLISGWILTGIPAIGISGTPISTMLSYFVMAMLNLIFVIRKTGTALPLFSLLWKPTLSALLCAGSAAGAYRLLSARLSGNAAALCAIGAAALVYAAALAALRALDAEVLSLLPFCRRKRPRQPPSVISA